MDIKVDPDLKKAATLPADCYLSEEIARLEETRVFKRSWQLSQVRQDSLKKTGSFATETLSHEPLVWVKGNDGKVRSLINVCRHRASTVAQGEGVCQTLKCPYHGWTYSLEGKLIGQPEFEGAENWDRNQVSLPGVAHETWGPLNFVKLSAEGMSFSDWRGEIPQDLAKHEYDLASYRFLTRKQYEVNCNWKVYVDNYLEGYHLPSVHPDLFKEVDYKAYRVETFRYYSSQFAPLKENGELAKTSSEKKQALYYWLFPNFMLNLYPDQMHTSVVFPVSIDKTLVVFDWYLPPGVSSADVDKLTAFNDQVQKEDMIICERVQAGLRSSSYEQGRFSPKRENGVHHFHRLMAEFLKE